MKFIIKKEILMENLNNVSKAISSKNLIPILSGIKFELNKEFELIELIIEDYKKNQNILNMRLDNEITNFDNKKMDHLIKDIKNNKYLAPYIEII